MQRRSYNRIDPDKVYALIREVAPAPLVVNDTAIRQLWPLLEELVVLRSERGQ